MFIYQTATALHETNSQWAFPVRYNGDIFAVNRSGASGKTELHILSASSDYQSFSNHVATALHPTDENWDFGVGYNGDLFAFSRYGASGRVEVHVLTSSSDYRDFRLHAVTALHHVNPIWDLLLGPDDDFYAVTRQGGSGNTEVHVMRAANDYSTFAFQTATALHGTGPNWSFAISSNRDLCGALHHGATGTTEIHVLTAESDYQLFGLHTGTDLHPIDNTWAFAVPQPLAPGFIKRQGTASGKTEVHVPTAISLPKSSFQTNYLNLIDGRSDAELTDMMGECGFQVAVWGANGGVTGGVRGAVAGAVAGALASKECRDLVRDHFKSRDREHFERMDRTNQDLESWERGRNTA
jgi:hypothetical protein